VLVGPQAGAVALAARVWVALEQQGFAGEELLLHAPSAGRSDLPPLHAAAASGDPRAVRR
jgi:hypothetical protein